MVEKCGFCSQSLNSIPELIDHYSNSHKTTKDNSPIFKSYVDLFTKPSSQFFMGGVNTVVRCFLMENRSLSTI